MNNPNSENGLNLFLFVAALIVLSVLGFAAFALWGAFNNPDHGGFSGGN